MIHRTGELPPLELHTDTPLARSDYTKYKLYTHTLKLPMLHRLIVYTMSTLSLLVPKQYCRIVTQNAFSCPAEITPTRLS